MMETLLVLSIISILVALSFVKLSPILEKKVMPYFFEQLSNDLLLAQQYSMSTKQSVNIIIFPENRLYYVHVPNENKILLLRNYNEHIYINTRQAGNTVRFNNVGNIASPGSYGISYKSKEHYSLVFQLGFGRFYVEKV
ncbi:MAG: hypothetical protein LPK00_03020 [Bacillaceae bacterium]|nr:hypothetical protein [Bacillaceae bacterium]